MCITKGLMITSAALALLTTAAHAQVPSNGDDTLACRSARGEMTGSINPRGIPEFVLQQMREKDARSRQSAQAACDQIKREQAVQIKQYNDGQARLAEVRAAEQERRRQAEQAVADKKAQAQAEYDALPQEEKQRRKATGLLLDGYRFYAHVKWCHEVREGYAYKAINDVELERAEGAIKSIVDQATKSSASVNTDDVWQQARVHERACRGLPEFDARAVQVVADASLRHPETLNATLTFRHRAFRCAARSAIPVISTTDKQHDEDCNSTRADADRNRSIGAVSEPHVLRAKWRCDWTIDNEQQRSNHLLRSKRWRDWPRCSKQQRYDHVLRTERWRDWPRHHVARLRSLTFSIGPSNSVPIRNAIWKTPG